MGLIIGIIVAVLVLGGGAFFYVQSENAKKEAQRVADEKAAAEKRAKEEAEKARLAAEQKAREEEAARKKREEEFAAKLAAAENARKEAEEKAKAEQAARLANARGTVVVTTEPAGATVTLGSLPPQKSPATFETKIGTYPLTIALVNHDEVKTEVEVKENATTQVPLQKLVKIVGAIELTSDPAGVNFELHPANGMMVAPDLRRSGQTPAKADNLQPGDYVVTFTREGWQPHTETVKVERDGVAKATASFPNGVIKITSSPDGATITRNGVKIGVTPLTLSDQQPGNVRFDLSLAGYENAQVAGRVESGKMLNLAIALLSVDRLATLAELDEKPKAIATPSPDLPGELADKPGRVLIEFTVTKTGATKDVKVLETSSAELGKLFVEAVTRWKFKPGAIGGKPMNARVQQPFVVGSK